MLIILNTKKDVNTRMIGINKIKKKNDRYWEPKRLILQYLEYDFFYQNAHFYEVSMYFIPSHDAYQLKRIKY